MQKLLISLLCIFFTASSYASDAADTGVESSIRTKDESSRLIMDFDNSFEDCKDFLKDMPKAALDKAKVHIEAALKVAKNAGVDVNLSRVRGALYIEIKADEELDLSASLAPPKEDASTAKIFYAEVLW